MRTQNTKSRRTRITVIVGVLIASALVAVTTALGSTPIERSSLSEVPGFGATNQAAARDDAVAFYEAFQRENLVQACMARTGFDYQVEVAYPDGVVLEVAAYLGVEPSESDVVDASASLADGERARNWANFRSLPTGDRDRYAMALYGESADDLIAVGETGSAPGGGANFATGGCYGEAQSAVPGIWTLKRSMAVDLEATRTKAFEMAVNDGAYARCAKSYGLDARSPGDVEAALVEATLSLEVGEKILEGCVGVWDDTIGVARNTVEEGLVANRQPEFDDQRRQYEGILDTIKTDTAFIQYVNDVSVYLLSQPAPLVHEGE